MIMPNIINVLNKYNIYDPSITRIIDFYRLNNSNAIMNIINNSETQKASKVVADKSIRYIPIDLILDDILYYFHKLYISDPNIEGLNFYDYIVDFFNSPIPKIKSSEGTIIFNNIMVETYLKILKG